MNFFIISSSFLTFFILYNYNALIAGYPDYLSRLSRVLLSFFPQTLLETAVYLMTVEIKKYKSPLAYSSFIKQT